ncbi:ABC transporter permease subunit [Cytobacillus kochii]|nr:ABC transporter permease subunit [Cytobacillus kochii]MCM3322920.1 ABC transporter permease subunit [Cytobacillus kochii]MCM3344601.1 ABC transporter permease subunit [Cytobacillus kochii]MDM5209131.1 ABC transporter permease subunit [Cytobacillus kochii]
MSELSNQKKSISPPFWRNKKIIPIILQVVFAIIVLAFGYLLIDNALSGLRQIGLQLGFDFLANTAGFSISEAMIDYQPTDTYGKALLIGMLNTLRVAFFGIILTTILGLIVGLSRMSNNWLLSKIAGVYIEIFRNTPLLVQIFIWFYAVFLPMPKIQEALQIGPMLFSNRGTAIPWYEKNQGILLWGILFLVSLVIALFVYRLMLKKQIESGKKNFPSLWALGVIVVIAIISYVVTGNTPVTFHVPSVAGNGFDGGFVLSPGFSAILLGLVIYTSTFIAEIIRAGVNGVNKGQSEAAKALGLKNSTALRLVIFPQAIRIIIPPLTSQYLNLTKNSSLAVAVGYQEIVSIGNTVMNQAGRPIEAIAIMIVVYLTFSLITSLFMNYFNKKAQLVER